MNTGTAGAGNAAQDIYIDGALVASRTGVTFGWRDPAYWWGTQGDSFDFTWNGRMAFFALYGAALSTEDADELAAYLNTRFGV